MLSLCEGFQQTPLHMAARVGHTNIVELLIYHGAYVDKYDSQ